MDKIDIIALKQRSGVDDGIIKKLLNAEKQYALTTSAAMHAFLKSGALKLGKAQSVVISVFHPTTRDALRFEAQRQLQSWQKREATVISICCHAYPDKLRRLHDAPSYLFCKGDTTLLNASDKIAVIGTRKPTDSGKRSAYNVAGELARKNTVVVSGLALGIDAAAHQGCLIA